MSWRDNLQSASFRSVPFKVLDAETLIGRRNVLHQYPFKDEPYVEDLGEDAQEFTIVGYVIQEPGNGFDYFSERDALISVLRESGSGTLVHPFLGELIVALSGKARLSETFQEGGIARFTMTFVQAGENLFPQSPQDTTSAVDNASENCLDIFADTLNTLYSLTGMPGYVVSQGVTDLTSGMNMIKSSITSIQGSVVSTISKALDIVDESKALLDTVITSPCSLGANMVSGFDSYLTIVGMVGDTFSQFLEGDCSGKLTPRFTSTDFIDNDLGKSVIKSMVAINRFGELASDDPSAYGGLVDEIPIINSIRAREASNRIAYTNMFRASAIAQSARVAVRVKYKSSDDAVEVMESITEAADDLLLKMGNEVSDSVYITYGIKVNNEDSYEALDALKPVFIESMKQIGAALAGVIDYETPPGVINTLNVAYELYGDATRDEEIQDRNKGVITHPGFLPQNSTVEVLSE